MKLINQLDSPKTLGVIASITFVIFAIALLLPDSVFRALMFIVVALGVVSIAIFGIRGIVRRVQFLIRDVSSLKKEVSTVKTNVQSVNKELQNVSNKVTDGINKNFGSVNKEIAEVHRAIATVNLNVSAAKAKTASIPDIAGSVSKGRNLQVSMSKVLNQLVAGTTPVIKPSAPSINVEAVRAEATAKALERVNTNTAQKAVESEKRWRLEHDLVLPHNVAIDNLSYLSKHIKLAQRVKVAVIMDPFSYGSFGPELDTIPLLPETWREQFEQNNPEIFICESAWQGVPGNKNPWKAQIYSSINFNYENRKELLKILDYCKKNSIPTVFWNKEDPTHFPDRVNDFVSTAKLFDYIFTTAEEVIPGYNQLVGRNAADCLPFAVQPRIFHPKLEAVKSENNNVVFAGSWYKKHEDRKILQKHLLDESINAGLNLIIHDRYAGKDNEQFGFPSEYKQYIKPAVPYEKTVSLYQDNRYGISINTVIDSKTMLARRAFEMAATGCGIITNGTPAIDNFFGDSVLSVGLNDKITLEDLQKLDSNKLPLLNDVLQNHTYENRVKKLLNAVGISAVGTSEKLSVIVWVKTLEEVSVAKQKFQKLGSVAGNLILIVSQEVENHRVQQFYKQGIDANTSVISELFWNENNVKPQTIFDLPYVLAARSVENIGSTAEVKRALSHAVYSHDPVLASEIPVWPKTTFGNPDQGAVMSAGQFDYLMRNGFAERMMTLV